MSKDVLVTDSLFIGPRQEALLIKHGFKIHRLDKPKATEEELCEAVQGKIGYILGGIEHVTDRVISAADKLKAIAFTGSGFSEFVPGYRLATKKGIAITSVPGGNAEAVAEYALGLILMMARRIPLLSSPGGMSFSTGEAFCDLKVGVVGYGHIGRLVAQKCKALGFLVLANSRKRATGRDKSVKFVPLPDLVASCDIVTVHVDKIHGHEVISEKMVRSLKNGVSIVNAAFPEAVHLHSLIERISKKEIYAAFDAPIDLKQRALPVGFFLQSNAQTAFNTRRANETISISATQSLINVLTKGRDRHIVNPEFYKNWKK